MDEVKGIRITTHSFWALAYLFCLQVEVAGSRERQVISKGTYCNGGN
jgi:hypothetical protein